MPDLTQKITEAVKYAMSIRPKVGGFSILAEALRSAGVNTNRWTLPSCQSVYITDSGSVVQQGNPLVSGMYEIPKFDREALIKAIRVDQQGESTFMEFLNADWQAGTVGYDVDFRGRKVLYYGVNGESYLEEYPAVELKSL
jgi:uncharacterized protein YbcV (DUF1398 family)